MAKKKPQAAYLAAPEDEPNFDALDQFLGGLEASKPAQELPNRGVLRGMADVALAGGRGAVQGVRMFTDLAGSDNAASRGLRTVEDFIGGLRSAQAKQDDQEAAAILKAAENAGILDQVVAGAKAFAVAPVSTLAQAVGTSIPTIGAALIPGVGQGAAVARMGAALGMGAAQGAGSVKGQIYDEVKQELLQAGASPEEAERRALEASSYDQSGGKIATGAALGALAGSTGMERAIGAIAHGMAKQAPGMARRVLTHGMAKQAPGMAKQAPGMARRVLTHGATEALPESAQGAQEKLASNQALYEQGFDVAPGAGVVAAGTMEGLAGYGMGAAAGLPRPAVRAGDQLRAEGLQPERGPYTRASNAAVEAAANKVDANPSLAAAADKIAAVGGVAPIDPTISPDEALMRMEAEASALDSPDGTPTRDDWSRLATAPQAEPEAPWMAEARAIAAADQAEIERERQQQEKAARLAQIEAAPVDRAPRVRTPEPATPAPAVPADVVQAYVESRRNDGTPAGRFFAGEFDAGRITRDEVQGLIDAARPKSPDQRLAEAAAQAPKPQAPQPGDILNPKGEPFRNMRAAEKVAQREGGSVIVVDGGWSVRPKEADARTSNAPEPGGPAGEPVADARRGARTGELRDQRPADVQVSAAGTADEVRAGDGAAAVQPGGVGTAPELSGLADSTLQLAGDVGPAGEMTRGMGIPDEDWQILKDAGLVQVGTQEDGGTYEYVPAAALGKERDRRFEVARASRRPVSAQEKAEGIERRARNYERVADEKEDAGFADEAAELRKKAAEIRAASNHTSNNIPTLKRQWQAAVQAGDGATARAINERIVALKANAAVQPATEAPASQAAAPGAVAAAPAANVPGAGGGAVEADGVTQGGPGSDAGNGFKNGPKKGERYRVGAVAAAGGALALEKRLPAGTAATFYVGKDGNFIDSDDVNFIGSGRERFWIPESKEAADRATALLDELGRLELTDPKRKEVKDRLKALVTSAASGSTEADGVKPSPLGLSEEQRRAAIDAETMEDRPDAPEVAQPTKGRRVKVYSRTLNGINDVTAHLYELPGYKGPQLAVKEYKSSRGQGYRVYLPKSGAFIADSNGVSSLDDTLKLAVLRIGNARDAISKRPASASLAAAPEAEKPSIPKSKKVAQVKAKREAKATAAPAAPESAAATPQGERNGDEAQAQAQEVLSNKPADVTTAGATATHADPGEAAEPATPAVVKEAAQNEYPLGKTDREDRFFGTRVRVLPDLRGDTPWEGVIHSTLNGGRLFSVKRADNDNGTFRISGNRIKVLEVKDAEKADTKPKEPTKAPASINMLPLADRWDALVAHTKEDGGDPDKGQRSYRAFTQLVGRSYDKPADVWDRWSSFIGSTDLVNRTGPEVLKWMESNLPTLLDGYIRSLPGAATLSVNAGDARYWQNTAAELERRTPDYNRYINRLEQQAMDVEVLGGDAKKVAKARETIQSVKRAFNKNEGTVRQGLSMAEAKEKEDAERAKTAEAAKYKPFDAKELSKKPTPASMSGWFTANYDGKTVWTQGTILDISGDPPHLAGYEQRLDTLGRNKDGKLDVSRVIPRERGPQAVPFGFYDGEFGKSKNGVVYFDADGRVVAADAILFRYFASKFKGATYYASPNADAITVRQGDKTVGVLMPIRLGDSARPAPTLAELKEKIAKSPAPTPQPPDLATGAAEQAPEQAKTLPDLIQAYKAAKAQERALADAKNVDLNKLARAVDATRAARAPLVAQLSKQPALSATNSNGLRRIVAGSAQKPGQWQLTRFDQNGEPWGDSQYSSQEAAIDDFLREVDIDTLEMGDAPAAPAAEPAPQPEKQEAAPASAQAAIDAWNADDHERAMAVVAKIRTKDELRKVGEGVGYSMHYGEGADAYRKRLAEVAPRLNKTAREKAVRQRALFDKLMDRAMDYDRAADHAARAKANGVADDSTAYIGFYKPLGGGESQEMRIPAMLDRLASDVESLRNDPDYSEVAPMVQSKRPRVFEHKAVQAEEATHADPGEAAEPTPAPAVPQESAESIARRSGIQERARAYFDATATPAIREYLRAFDAFGADRMERNRIKPAGMTARQWLESFVSRQSKWDGSRKVQGTGIEALSAKDLWPTDDGLGERLRKSMLAAVRALKNAPMTSSEMLAEAFMEPKAAEPDPSAPKQDAAAEPPAPQPEKQEAAPASAPAPAAATKRTGQYEASEVFAIYRAAESAARGLWSSSGAGKHNTKLRKGLRELGLKQTQVDNVMAEAATVHAQRTRGSTTMTYLSGQDFMAGARRAGVVAEQAAAAPAAEPAPQPEKQEATPALVNGAIDAFVKTLKTREDDAGNVAMFSRATTTGPRVNLESARQLADQLASTGLLRLNVVQSTTDMPMRLQRQLSKSAPDGRVRGAYFRGTDEVWMVADHIRGANEFVEVALHEAFHRGLGKLIPDAKPLLREIWRTNQNVRKATADQMRQHGIGRDEAIEEALAKMAEAGEVRDLKGWPKLLEAIRTWLGKMARAVGIEMVWTDDMVADLVAASTREGLKAGVHADPATDAAAAKRAPSVTVETDEATGAPVYATDDISIGFPQETERFEYVLQDGEKIVNYSIGPADGFDSYGFVELVIGADGIPKALADIEVKPELRGQAIGEKVMAAILGAHPGADIEISNIVEGARGFWAKMGVPEQNRAAGEAYDGTLNYQTFQAAQDERAANRAAAGRGAAGEGRNARAEDGAQGADGQAQGLMLSRAEPADATDMRSAPVVRQIQQRAHDLLATRRTFNWWHRTVGTQYHKAQVDADFGKVYTAAQDFIHDTSAFANDPADLAPDLLPQLKSLGDLKKTLGLNKRDRESMAAAVFEGTLDWMRDDSGQPVKAGPDDTAGIVWTPAELRERFGFNDRQVKLYEQFRASVDRSLDTLVASDVVRLLGSELPPGMRALVSSGDLGRFKGLVTAFVKQQAEAEAPTFATKHAKQIADLEAERKAAYATTRAGSRLSIEQQWDDKLEALKEAQKQEVEQSKWGALAAEVEGKYERIDDLKARGYAPLMRFGRYTVDVVSGDGERKFFGLYESEAEANRAARQFKEGADPGDEVTQGVLSEEAYKQFQGMTPETLELFAEVAGVEKNEVFQEYLRRAKNNRSALKRLIHRKGIAGYSEDASRVLAQFLTSNARAASSNLHMGEMAKAVQDIPKQKGDVIDEAIRLREYVQTPQEEAQALRGLMFASFLGGSVASAMVNLTQPLMMTFPYLSQFGGPAKAASRLMGAMGAALGNYDRESALGKALAMAEKEGIVSPQEMHQLQAEASGSLAKHPAWRRLTFAWGSLFSAAEQFNRRLSFVAAYNTAVAEGKADPFKFAARSVDETQGVYTKANKPRWARGTVGAVAFTFKQYSVSYMEFLKRLPTRERTLALAVLLLAAGAQGMPGADDLDDLIDTLGQGLGYDTNAKLWKTRVLSEAIGSDGADFVLRGFSALPGFPLDVAGRLGLGNMIPGTGLLLKSKQDKAGEVAEALGPAASLAKGVAGAVPALASGNVAGVVEGIAPKAMKDLVKSLEMYRTGEYRDTKGRKVTEADATDALVKGLGFQPAQVARDSRRVQMANQQIALAKVTEAEFAEAIARARVDGDPDGERKARQRLAEWNARNPESRIAITPSQVARRARELRTTRDERFIRTAPKEMRQSIRETMQ